MLRLTTTIPLTMSVLFCLGLGFSSANAEDPKPCKRTKFEFSQVEAACAKGGEPEAKKLMKSLVNKAKAAGQEIKCNSCHKNLKTYELTENGAADLKKLL